MKKKLFMLMLLLVGASSAMAQGYDYKEDPKYGPDPASREKNVAILNFFNDSYQMKAFDDATIYMRELMVNCPQASENIFIKGGEIYRNKLSRAKSKIERMAALDSMMIIYDTRVKTYGDHPKRGKAYILARKAQDFYIYAPGETTRAFGYFRDAVNAAKENYNLDPEMSKIFFNALTENYKLGDITPDDYMADYESMMTELTQGEQEDDATAEAIMALETLFAQSGAANCENIEKIYKPKFNADPSNVETLRKIASLTSRSKCGGTFQLAVLEQLYKIDPKPEVALMLAGTYEEAKDYTKAIHYIEIAIKNETDPAKRYSHMLRAAGSNLGAGNYRVAADFSQQAIRLNPDNGLGYLLYANALAGGSSAACSGFERQAAYWLVVDAFVQARSHFTSDPVQTDQINRAIGSYSASFPKTEDTFLRNLNQGEGYTVNCGWISGRTTVRER